MSGLDLVLTVLSTGESVTLSQWNNSPDNHETHVEFHDGSVLDLAALAVNVDGTEGNDFLRVRIKPTSCPVTPVVTDCLVGAVTTHLSAVRATTH
ncbi:MAG: hypothetical protein IPL72_13885 [Sulfuritalea sp.]|nr:hypothetical protein [Sulfuritalea sp.]